MPSKADREQPAAIIGLISDTHMPLRWPSLPAELFERFAGVDLILHAGDVGELWVLDQLSEIAPVVAVHGNDDTVAARTQLPFQQLIQVAGQRILLWHSHHPDREIEMKTRRIDTWDRILRHNADRARAAGASLVVMGHLHVPFVTQYEGVWIVNPGAIASGNFLTRQAPQTVARLQILKDGAPYVEHTNLATDEWAFRHVIDWDAPFTSVLAHFSAPIFSREAREEVQLVSRELFMKAPEAYLALLSPLAHRCWAGKQAEITASDLLAALAQSNGIPVEDHRHLTELLEAVAI